jgi:hypothetical protein
MPCYWLKQLDPTSQLLGSYHAITEGILVLEENGTSQSGVLPEKLTFPELSRNSPHSIETEPITAYVTAHHLFLSWDK